MSRRRGALKPARRSTPGLGPSGKLLRSPSNNRSTSWTASRTFAATGRPACLAAHRTAAGLRGAPRADSAVAHRSSSCRRLRSPPPPPWPASLGCPSRPRARPGRASTGGDPTTKSIERGRDGVHRTGGSRSGHSGRTATREHAVRHPRRCTQPTSTVPPQPLSKGGCEHRNWPMRPRVSIQRGPSGSGHTVVTNAPESGGIRWPGWTSAST